MGREFSGIADYDWLQEPPGRPDAKGTRNTKKESVVIPHSPEAWPGPLSSPSHSLAHMCSPPGAFLRLAGPPLPGTCDAAATLASTPFQASCFAFSLPAQYERPSIYLKKDRQTTNEDEN